MDQLLAQARRVCSNWMEVDRWEEVVEEVRRRAAVEWRMPKDE